MGSQLTPRDMLILEKLFTARYLTTQQIHALYFKGSGGAVGHVKACERRMRTLYDNEYVRRIEMRMALGEGRIPYVYALAKRGAQLVSVSLGVPLSEIDYHAREAENNYPFLTHLLATNSFQIALMGGCAAAGITIREWSDEKELRVDRTTEYVTITSPTGVTQKVAVIPDAAFIIEKEIAGEKKQSVCFVEVDQSTVVVSPTTWEKQGWGKKVSAYLAYIRSPDYRNRYGAKRPRILTVTRGEQRLHNLMATTVERGGRSEFWFALQSDAFDPTKILSTPIWQVAGEDSPRNLV